MNRNVCIHKPEFVIPSIDGYVFDYFCSVCKAKVGYFSRLICLSVSELLRRAKIVVDSLSIVQPKKTLMQLLEECETQTQESQS